MYALKLKHAACEVYSVQYGAVRITSTITMGTHRTKENASRTKIRINCRPNPLSPRIFLSNPKISTYLIAKLSHLHIGLLTTNDPHDLPSSPILYHRVRPGIDRHHVRPYSSNHSSTLLQSRHIKSSPGLGTPRFRQLARYICIIKENDNTLG